ncbi:MAG TPA: hypothetical protein PLW14_06065 [Chlorobiota bacterium]|nr:hypothetical protein [Chlorobiota bacterium]
MKKLMLAGLAIVCAAGFATAGVLCEEKAEKSTSKKASCCTVKAGKATAHATAAKKEDCDDEGTASCSTTKKGKAKGTAAKGGSCCSTKSMTTKTASTVQTEEQGAAVSTVVPAPETK